MTSRFARADAVQILTPAPGRVEPPCPYAHPGGCGGCDWQHASLPTQRELKAAVVAQQLRRIASIEWPVTVEALPGDRPGDLEPGLGWRTRVTFAVRPDGLAGLRAHRSHHVVPIDDCLIAHPRIRDLGVTRRRWPRARSVEAATGTGGPERAVIVTGGQAARGPGRDSGRSGARAGAGPDDRVPRPPVPDPAGRRADLAGQRGRVLAGASRRWRTPWSRRSWRRCSRSRATPRWTCTAGLGCSPGCWPRPSARTARWPGWRPTAPRSATPVATCGRHPGPPSTRATPARCWPAASPICLRRGSRSWTRPAPGSARDVIDYLNRPAPAPGRPAAHRLRLLRPGHPGP